MTTVDEIFRSTGTKRKNPPIPSHDPSTFYKSAKTSANGTPHPATVKDDTADSDVEAGPALPPDNPEEDADEDDEGRFFGSGVSANTQQALEYVDGADADDAPEEVIDVAWLRKRAVAFEKGINRNAELRARYEADPQKFVASEADLNADIKAWAVLAEYADLYSEFVKLGCVGSLVSLLAHENADIAIEVVTVLAELTDEDVEVDEKVFDELVASMIEAGVVELLVQNLQRLDETDENDRAGVYHILDLLENLCSLKTGDELGSETMLQWLLERISKKEPVGQNTQSAAEVLTIILQSGPLARSKFISLNSVESLLLILSKYRKSDPEKDSYEAEYVENLFSCLVHAVDTLAGKTKFLEGEGVELCLIMLRDGKMSKTRALRVLSHATSPPGADVVCQRLIEAAGLKPLFAMLMRHKDRESVEHLTTIFMNLLDRLEDESSPRIRLLAKFVEKDYEKMARLVKLRGDYVVRLAAVEKEIIEEAKLSDEEEDDEDVVTARRYRRRLDAGLYSLQLIDVVLGMLVATYDSGLTAKLLQLQEATGKSFEDIRKNVAAFRQDIEPDKGDERGGELAQRIDLVLESFPQVDEVAT